MRKELLGIDNNSARMLKILAFALASLQTTMWGGVQARGPGPRFGSAVEVVVANEPGSVYLGADFDYPYEDNNGPAIAEPCAHIHCGEEIFVDTYSEYGNASGICSFFAVFYAHQFRDRNHAVVCTAFIGKMERRLRVDAAYQYDAKNGELALSLGEVTRCTGAPWEFKNPWNRIPNAVRHMVLLMLFFSAVSLQCKSPRIVRAQTPYPPFLNDDSLCTTTVGFEVGAQSATKTNSSGIVVKKSFIVWKKRSPPAADADGEVAFEGICDIGGEAVDINVFA